MRVVQVSVLTFCLCGCAVSWGSPRPGWLPPPSGPCTGVFFEEGAVFSAELRRWRCSAPGPRDEAKRPLLSSSLGPSFPGFNERRVAPPRLSSALSAFSVRATLLRQRGRESEKTITSENRLFPDFHLPRAAAAAAARRGAAFAVGTSCSNSPVSCFLWLWMHVVYLPSSGLGGIYVQTHV